MAKVQVILHCQIEDGKEVRQPGETFAMEEAEAKTLALLGMVQLLQKKESKRKSGKGIEEEAELGVQDKSTSIDTVPEQDCDLDLDQGDKQNTDFDSDTKVDTELDADQTTDTGHNSLQESTLDKEENHV